MARKTPAQKLRTKITNLLKDENLTEEDGKIVFGDYELFSFSDEQIDYGTNRYYASKKEELSSEYFKVTIPLTDANLDLLSSNIANPPNRSRQVIDLFKTVTENELNHIVVGADKNELTENKLTITSELYNFLIDVDKDEAQNKKARLLNRIGPTLEKELDISIEKQEESINYSLLLKEVIDRGDFTQLDIQTLTEQLDSGETNKVVIESRINHQVSWLLKTIETILEEDKMIVSKAKNIGNEHFGYTKVSITGPEHLMEKILSDYGQFTLFGVPALLNTDKYVIRNDGLPRIQFDIVLIDHLGEVEIVELKRPDKHLLDYDKSRNKFYPCKDLSVAISQTERYITAVYNKKDTDQLIDGKTLLEFINSEIGETLALDSLRPRGVIIMGSYDKLCKPYSSLSIATRAKVTEDEYRSNCVQAYKEIKDSFKNIKIITYSELLETARTRITIADEEE